MGGPGAPPPPTHKIKENLRILIVFVVGLGGAGGPPQLQNQRKPLDFHSFWNGVRGRVPPTHPQNQRKPMDFHSFWSGVGGRVPPSPPIAETYWGALRVPRAPSVKPGAACCCLCLFAWSPSGTPTSPGPRRRLFNNAGSNAARRSVTLCVQKTTKPDISHEQFTGNPMFFPRSL